MTKNVVNKCVICKRLRATPMQQQMGELPEDRISKSPPFTHTEMDCFGPFIVKDRRTDSKKYGLVFTCLYSRAIHIELLDGLTTDAFINALRCFISLRGSVRTLDSDNGTNFVGGKNELNRQWLNSMNSSAKDFFIERQIEFVFSTPTASHQGGVWERQIRTIRAVLNEIFLKYSNRIDTASLRTAFCEVTAIVNNRPLSIVNINNHEELPLTPNMILTGKPESTPPPPGDFKEDIYCRARWKRVQCLAEEFWRRWKLDYLKNITQRQTWRSSKENLRVNDMVLVVDLDSPRNCWKIGRIEEVHRGEDGLVRKAKVRLGRKGVPMEKPTFLERPVQKLVKLMKS